MAVSFGHQVSAFEVHVSCARAIAVIDGLGGARNNIYAEGRPLARLLVCIDRCGLTATCTSGRLAAVCVLRITESNCYGDDEHKLNQALHKRYPCPELG